MTSGNRLRRSCAAVAAAAAIALVSSPLRVLAAQGGSPGHSPGHAHGQGNGKAKGNADQHGPDGNGSDGNGQGQDNDSSGGSGSAGTPDVTTVGRRAQVAALTAGPAGSASVITSAGRPVTSTAPLRGDVASSERAPGAIPIAVKIGVAAIAPAGVPALVPSLDGLIAVSQGAVPGEVGAPANDGVVAWEVIAVAEGIATLALVGTLLQLRRRSVVETR